MSRCIKLAFCLFTFTVSFAQEKWNLQKCVEYALANNISVKQTDLQSQFSSLALQQSKASQLPSFSFSNSVGLSFGLSETRLQAYYRITVSSIPGHRSRHR
jgi:hypothetical protein